MNQGVKLFAVACIWIFVFYLYNQVFYRKLSGKIMTVKADDHNITDQIALLMQQTPRGMRNVVNALEADLRSSVRTLDTETNALKSTEANIPSQHDMSVLLKQMTDEFEDYNIQFVSLVPEEIVNSDSQYDSLAIHLKFRSNYQNLMNYVSDLKDKSKFLRINRIEIAADASDTSKPLTSLDLIALISRREAVSVSAGEPESARTTGSQREAAESRERAKKPSFFASKGGNNLPGEHKLSMVVYQGGRPVAMIDGKVMKLGSVIEGKRIVAIESDNVQFVDEGGREYSLQLNQ